MRIVFNIEVGVDVQSYEEAGRVLDRVTREIAVAIGTLAASWATSGRVWTRP